MKKRLLKTTVGVLACSLLLSAFCGCGGNNPPQVESNTNIFNSEISATDNQNTSNTYIVTAAKAFNDGYAWIRIDKTGKEKNRYSKLACIDTNGKIQFVLNDLIEGEFYDNNIRNFDGGYAVVEDSEKNTFIVDTKGNIVSSSKDGIYDHVVSYGDGYFLIEKCNNDFHEIKYSFSVADCTGKILVNDCFSSDKEITNYSVFDYLGEGVFTYATVEYYGDHDKDYECVNSETGKKFSLNRIDHFSKFNSNVSIIIDDNGTQLLETNGNFKNINPNKLFPQSEIFNNCFVYCSSSSKGGDLLIYNISTGQSSELYHYGEGISVKYRGQDDDGILLEIEDLSNGSFNTKSWFVMVDYQGKELFKPIEGTPITDSVVTNIALSCGRIVVQETRIPVKDNSSENRAIYDTKGNPIEYGNKDTIVFGGRYHENYLCVNPSGASSDDNYLDINGNLLFPDNKITL